MGRRHLCCNKQQVRRGLWSPEEDEKLVNYISTNGHGCWSSLPRLAGKLNSNGLERCGKSCRLRWLNYLRPDLKRGKFSPQEATLIIQLRRIHGNRWSQIAKHLPGRTDNDVKNFWNSSIKKKLFSRAVSDLATLPNIFNHHSGSGFKEAPLPMTVNPSFIIDTQQEYFQLPDPMSMLQSSNNGDLKPILMEYDVNSLGMIPKILQDGSSPCDPTWSSNYQSLDDQNQEHEDHLLRFTSTDFCDPRVMPEMPKLCEMVDLGMDECTGLQSSYASSGTTHEIDPIASLPSLLSGSYQCVSTNPMEYTVAAIMPPSSSSWSLPCGHPHPHPHPRLYQTSTNQ